MDSARQDLVLRREAQVEALVGARELLAVRGEAVRVVVVDRTTEELLVEPHL